MIRLISLWYGSTQNQKNKPRCIEQRIILKQISSLKLLLFCCGGDGGVFGFVLFVCLFVFTSLTKHVLRRSVTLMSTEKVLKFSRKQSCVEDE